MKISKKDYNEYTLLWQCYRYLIDACQISGWPLEGFVIAFGLDSKQAEFIAQKEGIELVHDKELV